MNLKFYAGGGGGTGFEDDTPDMLIDSLGKIGIGTDIPATEFHVYDGNSLLVSIFESVTHDSRLRIKAPSTKFSQIEFADSDADTGEIRYDHTDDSMQFLVNANSEKLRIHSDGKLSLGTANAASAKFNISHGNEFALYTSGPYNYQAKFESTDAEAAIVIEDSNSGTDYNRIGVITNDMSFITNNSERLRITSTGRFQYYSSAGSFTSFRESFKSGAVTNGSTFTAQTHNCHACGTVTITSNLDGSSNNKKCMQFPISLNSTSNANLGSAIFEIDGSSGQNFSVAGASKGVTVTNSSGNTVHITVTFDITGSV